jgi:hypothetical protein
MPIYLDISHTDRIAVIVIQGMATNRDIVELAQRFIDSGVWGYRKIVDVSMGEWSIDGEALRAVAALLRASAKDAVRGPLAFVIDRTRGAAARKFVEMTGGERPIQIFDNIHDARRWLAENTGA